MKLLMTMGSPFARKVRLLAREKGLAPRIEEILVKVSPLERNAEVAQLNVLGKIPVLVLDDGAALYDSRVIVEYLDGLGDGRRMLPSEGSGRLEALCAQALCDGMLDAALLCRYELAMRPAALQWQAWLAGQRQKTEAGLSELEARAATWQDAFGLEQICAVCVLGYLDYRFSDWGWRLAHPNLASWFARISTRASVAETVPADA